MGLYFERKYFVHSIVFSAGLVVFPISFTEHTGPETERGLLFGGLFGGICTLYDFKKRHLWSFYDNLRYPTYPMLVIYYLAFLLLYFLIRPFI